ncbi:MAG TPA: AtpZ/AtpI family protein [Marmoricola sp.]|nr:AtpZ/AtpI family protein [Marmoricola sp.]HNJ78042.1 AtpZ/AtpI family protein [Marmoricola sp.]HNN47349.1 AtpZ/AtpI family protein [Marmoricola sp.]
MRKDSSPPPAGDPWVVVSHLIAGVALYGFLGWLLDQWLGTTYIVGIGIVLGAALGSYLTIVRVTRAQSRKSDQMTDKQEERQEKQ